MTQITSGSSCGPVASEVLATMRCVAELPLPWTQQEHESSPAFEAFTAYRDAEPRSLRAVEQQLGKSGALISRWSSQHNWVRRAAAWDAEQDRVRREAHLSEVEEVSRRHSRMLRQQLEVLAAPARELLSRLERDPALLRQLPPSELVDLVQHAARPLVQLVETERMVRGLSDRPRDEPCCEHEAARRRAERMSREELEAFLLGHEDGSGKRLVS